MVYFKGGHDGCFVCIQKSNDVGCTWNDLNAFRKSGRVNPHYSDDDATEEGICFDHVRDSSSFLFPEASRLQALNATATFNSKSISSSAGKFVAGEETIDTIRKDIVTMVDEVLRSDRISKEHAVEFHQKPLDI